MDEYEDEQGSSHDLSHHDDDPESECNDGKGIKYVITLYPLPPAPKAGEKRHKNAKVDPISRIVHVHENDTETLRSSNFTVTWTINRSHYKKMQLATTDDYSTMVTEAEKKAKPSVKVDIVELDTANSGTAQDTEPEEVNNVLKLTEEEESMAETVVQLKAAHLCLDKSCSSRWCFLGNPTGIHVRMTPIHLSTWAAAILAKTTGVDVDNPPPLDKTFWPTEARDDVDDIALLASHRRNQLESGNKSMPSVTVNNDLSAIAALFTPFLPTPAAVAPTFNALVSPSKRSVMDIATFCHAFGLSDDILHCLTPLKLKGPHLLEFVANAVLDVHLTIGERAELRHAEAEWKRGKKGV
ncbi:hypothetical protein C8R46DRAFT_1237640 [Mycena filopes]|nr:hypothetical protein C8R46DRAFT_1237640 [Mycena filopes]